MKIIAKVSQNNYNNLKKQIQYIVTLSQTIEHVLKRQCIYIRSTNLYKCIYMRSYICVLQKDTSFVVLRLAVIHAK